MPSQKVKPVPFERLPVIEGRWAWARPTAPVLCLHVRGPAAFWEPGQGMDDAPAVAIGPDVDGKLLLHDTGRLEFLSDAEFLGRYAITDQAAPYDVQNVVVAVIGEPE